MSIDWTISLGAMINFVGMLAAAFSFVAMQHGERRLLNYRLQQLELTDAKQVEELAKINMTLTIMTDQERRIGALEKLTDDLRRGEGFILPLDAALRKAGVRT